ncbi:hypothetical protein J3Q64DRAFT_1701297 [Phycomyces blakesleeanus]|uniref:Uncharacterized protein n=1 Tax=Phycomyces blakesleeanus TaxID=4837 RepID=A0ABR3ASE7_PHYBL
MLIGQMENEEPQLGLMDQDENSQLVKKVGKTYEQRRFIFQEDCSTYHIEPDTKVAKRRLCDQAFLINCSSQGLGNNPIEHKYLEGLYLHPIEHYGDYDALEINQNLGIVKEIYMRAQSVDLQGMVELSRSPF